MFVCISIELFFCLGLHACDLAFIGPFPDPRGKRTTGIYSITAMWGSSTVVAGLPPYIVALL